MTNNMTIYVEKLKGQGITTTEIIEKSGIGRTSFYEIMRGKQLPRIDTAVAIANALEVDVKEVFPQLDGDIKKNEEC